MLEPQIRPHASHWNVEVHVWPVVQNLRLLSMRHTQFFFETLEFRSVS